MIDKLISILENADPNIIFIVLGVIAIVFLFLFQKIIRKVIAKKFDVEDLKKFGEYLEKRIEVSNRNKRGSTVKYTMQSKVDDWLIMK